MLCVVKFFLRFNFFTGTFEGFCRNILELLQTEVHLSVRLYLKMMAIFCKLVIIFLGRNTTSNRFLDVRSKETNKVMRYRC